MNTYENMNFLSYAYCSTKKVYNLLEEGCSGLRKNVLHIKVFK